MKKPIHDNELWWLRNHSHCETASFLVFLKVKNKTKQPPHTHTHETKIPTAHTFESSLAVKSSFWDFSGYSFKGHSFPRIVFLRFWKSLHRIPVHGSRRDWVDGAVGLGWGGILLPLLTDGHTDPPAQPDVGKGPFLRWLVTLSQLSCASADCVFALLGNGVIWTMCAGL